MSLLIADAQPGDWDAALSLSGTVGWGSIGTDSETVLDRYAASGLRDTVVFLDSGGGGSCTDADGDGLQDDAPDGSDNYYAQLLRQPSKFPFQFLMCLEDDEDMAIHIP